jgi:dipeptidyl aminopeptidase/acylaminoacyl peptidase
MSVRKPIPILIALMAVAGIVLPGGAQQNAQRPPSAPATGTVESPDGTRSVWASADAKSLFAATRPRAGADWGTPDRLLTIRGTVKNVVFSPDSQRIAFENSRALNGTASTDKWSFIVVYDFVTRAISYVDPSFDIDTEPAWSSDGKEISFVRKVDGLPDAHVTRPFASGQVESRPGAARPTEAFTMASIIAAPVVYPPAASGDGRSIAYVAREARDRNIYFLRVGEPARRIVNFGGDDGQELSQVAVSVTGEAVAFVRGGPPNGQGDSPNPTALVEPPQPQVWIVGTRDDAPRFLGIGNAPRFTPDNQRVIWTSSGAASGAKLAWNNGRLAGVGAPEPYVRTPTSGLRFSPDGKRIAYARGGGIEVYETASRAAALIPHPNARDLDPVWSPDSRRIAFRRQPTGSRNTGISINNYAYNGPERSELPWAIWQADVSDLQPHEVWHAEANVVGSVHYPLDQGTDGDQLFWSANDRIVFAWERDGWRHLYSVPAAGGAPTLLTPGDGEVETVAITLDRKQLVYATNIGDLGRRHLSTLALDGTPAKSITSGDLSQWAPTPLADGALAYIAGGWADPPGVVVRTTTGASKPAELPKAPASFPSAKLVKPQLVEYPGTDGQKAFGQLFVPAQPNGCAVIFAHGGIRRQMLPGFHYLDAYSYLYEMNQYLTSRGCVVLSVEYRSSIMRGEAFRNAPGWGYAGNTEMLDVVGAANYLLARKDVDAARAVGIFGLSWGGYITSQALSRHSDIFKVGFDMAGVHDAPGERFKYGAISAIDTWASPVLLAQGDDDRNVTFTEGIKLARSLQLKRPNVEFVQRVFPGETHDLYLTFDHLVGIYDEGSQFLLRHLGVK